MPQKRSAFFISDRTGITAEMLGHSLLTQFEMVAFNEVTLPFIDTVAKAEATILGATGDVGAGGDVGVGVSGVLGYLAIFMPNFFIAPGLIQKLYGAKDESAVRAGVGWHAVVLLFYAVLPALLGMIARQAFPHLDNPELALPTVLRELLPWWLGALLLGAVFSAELSAGDAVLFMLSTSLGKDLYKTLINPSATEDQLLRFTRWTSVVAGVLGTVFAMLLPQVNRSCSVTRRGAKCWWPRV
mgnify:CR=1 FL=1